MDLKSIGQFILRLVTIHDPPEVLDGSADETGLSPEPCEDGPADDMGLPPCHPELCEVHQQIAWAHSPSCPGVRNESH